MNAKCLRKPGSLHHLNMIVEKLAYGILVRNAQAKKNAIISKVKKVHGWVYQINFGIAKLKPIEKTCSNS